MSVYSPFTGIKAVSDELWPVASPMQARPLLLLALELEAIGDHGDELRIGGLPLRVGDRVSKILLQGLQITPVPGHLNGVTDGPLPPGGGGAEALGHLRGRGPW